MGRLFPDQTRLGFLSARISPRRGGTAGEAATQTVARIGVLPFGIFVADPGKAAEWSQKILPAISSELSKDERVVLIPEDKLKEAVERTRRTEIDEEAAREIGRALDADFMILGSVTQINGAISVDARVVDVFQPGILASVFGQGRKPEEIPEMMARISREIRVKALKEEMITHIGVEGNRAIEESAVRAAVKMKPGDVLSPFPCGKT